MGLHSKVRYVIKLKSEKRVAQEDEIVQFTSRLYDFIFDYIRSDGSENLDFTKKFARFISKAFTFNGYEDDEIYSILIKSVDRVRKS